MEDIRKMLRKVFNDGVNPLDAIGEPPKPQAEGQPTSLNEDRVVEGMTPRDQNVLQELIEEYELGSVLAAMAYLCGVNSAVFSNIGDKASAQKWGEAGKAVGALGKKVKI